MDISGGIKASLAGRYAAALFELAEENKQLDAVESSLAKVKAALAESAEFAELTTSPLVGRATAVTSAVAVADSLGLDPLTKNFLGTLAENRRLAQLGAAIRAFSTIAAQYRGEANAEVASAHPLTDDQVAALKAKLKSLAGRDVNVDMTVDPSLLGGLVVRMGSRMIDGSIRTKLNSLASAMKG
ncbi:F0F1 ATP synthase subunit delta [Parasphingopyxis marina]|uniref:ATP synthase subunit delta n=1 Tax=Parasphingopyxis marina TaxID=2761622 RepID=A0A842HYD8_9SPHN|nr:F0F1 ATP synthase subunit delta [Parasphingopyxis marina]MBC2777361.1 F0F1 ATP synthase subunit delta [Parasphingopyxis marina]